MSASKQSSKPGIDSDGAKGAVEPDAPGQTSQNSMRGQLGHRTADEMIKDNDSDFPEPGSNPEHSGKPPEG